MEGSSALQTNSVDTRAPTEAAAEPVTFGGRVLRADARRNYQRLVAAATEVVAEQGPGASLEEVTRRAGVGVGTLYRHFPTRDDLLEAVFADQLKALGDLADELADAPDPGEALGRWLWACLQQTRSHRSLGAAVIARKADPTTPAGAAHERLRAGGAHLLERAQDAGWARPEITMSQAMTLMSGIALATEKAGLAPDDPRNAECFEIALRGMRACPDPARP